MDKATDMGKTSAVGSVHMFLGKMISSVILAVGTIILGYIISDNAYGLYAIAFILPNTVLIFQDWGIGQAMLRNCAQCRGANKLAEARNIIVAGLTFEIITGIMLTVVSL